MAIELKQSLKLSQQLVMTPQLQQAIKLLQLNRMELVEVINQELVENPVLEESGDSIDASEMGDEIARGDVEAPTTEAPREDQGDLVSGKDDFNWDQYIEEFNASSSAPTPSVKDMGEELPSFENVLTKTTSLEEHLEWQLSMATLLDEEKILGELIIRNLNDDGYLAADLKDLAEEAEIEFEDAEEVLKLIQKFDPVGVAARNLAECLMAQAQFLSPRQPLVEKLIESHLNDLEKRNYPKIAKECEAPVEDVVEATRVILEFEPKPGRSFAGSDTQYITPDIYVYNVNGEYTIVMNDDGLPRLRISPYYRKILQEAQRSSSTTKEYVQDKLKAALWLIRSIHNRQKTIYKVTEAIVQRQKDFFEKGVSALRPMVLKDVANDIGMHESTISRVTTNKFVHTPVGIFELKYFFNSSIGSSDGTDSLASEAVKEKIKALISKEDPKSPLSDQKLVEILAEDNINIARRTVAKYREMLGILSSSKRRKLY